MTAADQSAAVVIGLREVYEQLVRLTSTVGELRSDLHRVTDRLATTDKRLSEHAAWDQRRLDDHETRLRSVERSRWLLTGAASVVGAGGGYLASIIGGG